MFAFTPLIFSLARVEPLSVCHEFSDYMTFFPLYKYFNQPSFLFHFQGRPPRSIQGYHPPPSPLLQMQPGKDWDQKINLDQVGTVNNKWDPVITKFSPFFSIFRGFFKWELWKMKKDILILNVHLSLLHICACPNGQFVVLGQVTPLARVICAVFCSFVAM